MLVAVRRPLLVALVLACAVSLLASGRLTARLVFPSIVYWSFVPFLEIAALFAGSASARRAHSKAKIIDLFFASHGAWLLWVTAFTAYWVFLPTVDAFAWPGRDLLWFGSAGLVTAWSAYVDFGFFRAALQCGARQAARELLLQRLLAWTAGLALFTGFAGYQVVASGLGL